MIPTRLGCRTFSRSFPGDRHRTTRPTAISNPGRRRISALEAETLAVDFRRIRLGKGHCFRGPHTHVVCETNGGTGDTSRRGLQRCRDEISNATEISKSHGIRVGLAHLSASCRQERANVAGKTEWKKRIDDEEFAPTRPRMCNRRRIERYKNRLSSKPQNVAVIRYFSEYKIIVLYFARVDGPRPPGKRTTDRTDLGPCVCRYCQNVIVKTREQRFLGSAPSVESSVGEKYNGKLCPYSPLLSRAINMAPLRRRNH